MIHRLSHVLAIAAVLLFGSLFFYADHLSRQQIRHSAHLHALVADLGITQERVEEVLLKQAFFSYPNYDEIIVPLKRTREILQQLALELKKSGLDHEETRRRLEQLEHLLKERENAIYRFQTLNALIKNSSLQIPRLVTRYLDQNPTPDKEYLQLLARIAAEITLGKASLDTDLMPTLEKNIDRLRHWPVRTDQERRFNDIFLSHAEVVARNLPEYARLLGHVRDMPIPALIRDLKQAIDQQAQGTLNRVQKLHFLLTLAFAMAVLIIMALLVRTRHENRRLVALQESLKESALTDPLTGLGNRMAFSETRVEAPTLLLVNIDQFKHINDFYGVAAGDVVIHQLVRVLRHELGEHLSDRLFRISGDDFAILLSAEDRIRPEVLARQLVQAVERHAFNFEGNVIPLRISIGISHDEPLLETADLALRAVKRSRGTVLEYSAAAHLEEELEENLRMVQIVRDALRERRIVPFFQPILDNRTGRIARYECLMRIRLPDGTYLTPNRFLHIAHEARLSGELTRAMIEACLARFADNSLNFSINLSMEDMVDPTVTAYLFHELESRPELASRLTIEVLETEEIEDYVAVGSFLSHIRRLGSHIAIDDFGSGYSNLRQVLDLDVDQIKIDASLIRDLDNDPQSLATVRAIIEFARAGNIPAVVAEFVHSETIQQIVLKLGIDYSQGYWVGKPEPELPEPDGPPL